MHAPRVEPWGPVSCLRDDTPYAILQASFDPQRKPGYAAASERDLEQWDLRVNPVLREHRHAAHDLLLTEGMPAVRSWLEASSTRGWLLLHHQLDLVFDPTDGTLRAVESSRGA